MTSNHHLRMAHWQPSIRLYRGSTPSQNGSIYFLCLVMHCSTFFLYQGNQYLGHWLWVFNEYQKDKVQRYKSGFSHFALATFQNRNPKLWLRAVFGVVPHFGAGTFHFESRSLSLSIAFGCSLSYLCMLHTRLGTLLCQPIWELCIKCQWSWFRRLLSSLQSGFYLTIFPFSAHYAIIRVSRHARFGNRNGQPVRARARDRISCSLPT